MRDIVANFKKYSYLLEELVKKDIKLKYRKSYLGILWTLLEPLMTMLVLTVVFSKLYGRDDSTFPVYVLTGRLLYSFFSSCTKSATKSIRRNAGMIKKVYVPKYIYPVSNVISSYITFLISMIVLVGVSIYCKIKPSIYLLQGILPLFLLLVMALGVSLILATLSVFFRDLEYLWGVMTMLIMYSCAIFYQPERVLRTGYIWVLKINPLYAIIVNFRNAVIYHAPLDTFSTIYSVTFSFAVLFIGMYIFYKKQDEFILYI